MTGEKKADWDCGDLALFDQEFVCQWGDTGG
jgi:hypothetical protein